jgi:hypothetical protein
MRTGRQTDALIYVKHPGVQSGRLFSPSLYFDRHASRAQKYAVFSQCNCACFFGARGLDGDGHTNTGTVRVLFGTAVVAASLGNGKGTSTFHGKTYPFEASRCES